MTLMRQHKTRGRQATAARGEISQMWKSFLDALVKALAMCDPVAYMYYINSEQEGAQRAALRPYRESDHKYIAFSKLSSGAPGS